MGEASSTWGPQLDGLSEHDTVVAWNAPGAGGSSDPPESFGMAGCGHLCNLEAPDRFNRAVEDFLRGVSGV